MGKQYGVHDDQVSVISPGPELHGAVLEVKGEVQHNDLTVTLKDGRWVPRDHSSVLQQHFGLMNDGKVTISTAGKGRHRRHQHGDDSFNSNAERHKCLQEEGGHKRSWLLVCERVGVLMKSEQCRTGKGVSKYHWILCQYCLGISGFFFFLVVQS